MWHIWSALQPSKTMQHVHDLGGLIRWENCINIIKWLRHVGPKWPLKLSLFLASQALNLPGDSHHRERERKRKTWVERTPNWTRNSQMWRRPTCNLTFSAGASKTDTFSPDASAPCLTPLSHGTPTSPPPAPQEGNYSRGVGIHHQAGRRKLLYD